MQGQKISHHPFKAPPLPWHWSIVPRAIVPRVTLAGAVECTNAAVYTGDRFYVFDWNAFDTRSAKQGVLVLLIFDQEELIGVARCRLHDDRSMIPRPHPSGS